MCSNHPKSAGHLTPKPFFRQPLKGPTVPIGVELDPHCHLTEAMLRHSTALVCYKEYPHTDIAARAADLFHLIADAAEGKTRPKMAVFDCRMLGIYHTSAEPMRSYGDRLISLEGQNDVPSISVAHGFPWGDVPEAGTRLLVITDNRMDYGLDLARELGRELLGLRHRLQPTYLNLQDGLDRAVAVKESPVVIADVTDNPGSGAPGDSTFILQALLERGLDNAAIACIWDPVAVSLAMAAGEGARFDLRIGGKTGPASGLPVDLPVTVTKVVPQASQSFGQSQVRLGDAIAVHSHGIDIILNSRRTQTFAPDCFSNLGIDPSQKRLLIVKSSQHFYAAFAPIAAEVLYVVAPGAIVPDITQIPYRRVNQHKWPFVDNPLR